ncbi:MAG: hypothetical protein M1838_003076 [Thelocarpon superellum]|nr:MAG: hypothetical protein M1838_003076 [Thelocarpon superellum]
MRIRQARPLFLTTTTLLLPSLIIASDIDCSHIRVQKKSFDLSGLGGPHSVSHIVKEPPSISNTTYTIDICQPLVVPKKTPKEDSCPNFTRVCGIERIINSADDSSTIRSVRPIAGNFDHGRPIDAAVTRLKTSASHGDSQKEGLRMELHGGRYPQTKAGRKQTAVIEFLCDKEAEDEAPDRRRAAKEDEEDEEDEDEPDTEGQNLRFISYGPVDDEESQEDVLRLEWLTKHACEDAMNGDDDDSNGHWGFFTWFIIMYVPSAATSMTVHTNTENTSAFLATATYLIFGSWLNYNRYGARGWDLLPHGDTIRDIPYLMKDWTRRVINTAQGGGSRGGYSAV